VTKPLKFDAVPNCDTSEFVAALSLAANGVSIVTTDGEAGKAGLTVSSMVSVCAEPAVMLACVNTDNVFCGIADKNETFAINLLAADQQAISNVFAGFGDNPDADRFQHGHWTTRETGSPILSDALVSLDCALLEATTHGTHTIYIGRVLSVATRDTKPLVYSNRGYPSRSRGGSAHLA